jgi:hypothetical protein
MVFQAEKPEKWEGGGLGGASQETCQGTHRFSSRGGRLEKESSGALRWAGRVSVVGLGSKACSSIY